MARLQFPGTLISVDWLAEHLGDPGLVILDASVAPIKPYTVKSLPAALTARHIPGALRFDYDQQVCDRSSPYPHMMPDAGSFQAEARRLGINRDSAVLIYDDTGVYASPRAWWMFKAMGHDNVAVLDGGSPAWYLASQPMSATLGETAAIPGDFVSFERPGFFCDGMAVYQLLNDPSCRILDARSPGRFAGTEPEPRNNLRSGHMPNAVNLPFPAVLNDIHLKPVTALKEVFGAIAAPGQKLVFTCGSGLSACILTLAAHQAGYDILSVYDASWCEWGLPGKLPVEQSAV